VNRVQSAGFFCRRDRVRSIAFLAALEPATTWNSTENFTEEPVLGDRYDVFLEFVLLTLSYARVAFPRIRTAATAARPTAAGWFGQGRRGPAAAAAVSPWVAMSLAMSRPSRTPPVFWVMSIS